MRLGTREVFRAKLRKRNPKQFSGRRTTMTKCEFPGTPFGLTVKEMSRRGNVI